MTFLLTFRDIPYFWEVIKKAGKEADQVREENLPSYLTELLHALLSNNAQCFARLSDERVLEAIALTRVLFNKQTNEKYLFVQAMFSWQVVNKKVWDADMEFLVRFAKKEGCKYITCQSSNPRAWQLYEDIGLEEESRIFSVRL